MTFNSMHNHDTSTVNNDSKQDHFAEENIFCKDIMHGPTKYNQKCRGYAVDRGGGLHSSAQRKQR